MHFSFCSVFVHTWLRCSVCMCVCVFSVGQIKSLKIIALVIQSPTSYLSLSSLTTTLPSIRILNPLQSPGHSSTCQTLSPDIHIALTHSPFSNPVWMSSLTPVSSLNTIDKIGEPIMPFTTSLIHFCNFLMMLFSTWCIFMFICLLFSSLHSK